MVKVAAAVKVAAPVKPLSFLDALKARSAAAPASGGSGASNVAGTTPGTTTTGTIAEAGASSSESAPSGVSAGARGTTAGSKAREPRREKAGARPGSKAIFVTSRVGRDQTYYKLNNSAYPVPPAVTAKFNEMREKGFFGKHNVEELVRSKAWYELSRVTPEQGIEVLKNLSQINPVRVW